LILSALLVLALLVRLVRIDTIPGNLMLDEADNARNAYRILAGRGSGVTGLDWSQAPLFSMYVLAACIRVFGDTVGGIRSMAVLLSTLSLVPFYLIARRQVGVLSGACATLLLATSLWYLHFSRTAWINMTAPLFALCTVYFLTRSLERGRWRDYFVTGVCTTLGVYGYPAGLSIPAAVAASCPVAVMVDPGHWKRTVGGIGLTITLAAVLFAPHLWTAHGSRPGRMSQVSIFSADAYLGESNPAMIVMQQIGRNVAGFLLLDPGEMGRGLWAHYLPPGRTVLDHWTGLFFWVGLIAGLFRWRSVFLWWLFLVVPILTVQVLSMETPDAGRALVVAPFMYLFVALGMESLWITLRRWSSRLASGTVLVAVFLLAGSNLYAYVRWIESAQALNERHPAVELWEFPAWSRLQHDALESGRRGFVVSDWRKRIDNDGCKNGTLQGSVCSPTELLDEAVQNRVVSAAGSTEAAEARKHDPGGAHGRRRRPAVQSSYGASVTERDLIRRRDLERIAQVLEQLHADGHPYPTTGGRVQTLCFYDDDAGCGLHPLIAPIPADPRGIRAKSGYWYLSDGTSYTLYALLEGEANLQERCPERPGHIESTGDLICRRSR
jgi:4-amino-4-deoxy-L-arabinose transferase-like glycosyltransferase